MFHLGHVYSHGGIVVRWPVEMVHSWAARGVQATDPSIEARLRGRLQTALFFSPWAPVGQILTERLREALKKSSLIAPR
jgi:hypothetical protein